jgi:hypothetical protein
VEAVITDRIVAGSHPVEIGVAAIAADQGIVTATAVEPVGSAGALKRFRRAGALEPGGILDLRAVPGRAVGELDLLDPAGVELAFDLHLLAGRRDLDEQVIADAGKGHVANVQPGQEKHVRARIVVLLADRIVAGAGAVPVCVAIAVADQQVIAGSAVERVGVVSATLERLRRAGAIDRRLLMETLMVARLSP